MCGLTIGWRSPSGTSAPSRGKIPDVKKSWVVVLVTMLVGCGSGRADIGSGAGIESVADIRCGAITAPYSQEPPPLADPEDPDTEIGVEWFSRDVEGAFMLDTASWSVWEKTDDEIVLYGKTEDGYATASFVKEGEEWQATSWGICHWEVTVEGWGVAHWRVDGPVDPEATNLTLAATEINCANGEAPDGRDIESVVSETDESVTIVIFVEPVSGGATCPGNPEFTWSVQLDSPLGDRSLFDGREVPPIVIAAE
jgi:hypothetical protein